MKNGSKPAAVVGSGAVVVAGSPENEKNITENIYQVFNYFTKTLALKQIQTYHESREGKIYLQTPHDLGHCSRKNCLISSS